MFHLSLCFLGFFSALCSLTPPLSFLLISHHLLVSLISTLPGRFPSLSDSNRLYFLPFSPPSFSPDSFSLSLRLSTLRSNGVEADAVSWLEDGVGQKSGVQMTHTRASGGAGHDGALLSDGVTCARDVQKRLDLSDSESSLGMFSFPGLVLPLPLLILTCLLSPSTLSSQVHYKNVPDSPLSSDHSFSEAKDPRGSLLRSVWGRPLLELCGPPGSPPSGNRAPLLLQCAVLMSVLSCADASLGAAAEQAPLPSTPPQLSSAPLQPALALPLLR